jgi:hypothetical protein
VFSNTQSHTRAALQLKLYELTHSTSGAHNVMLTLEDMSLEELETFRTHYEKLAITAREKLRQGQADTASLRSPLGSGCYLGLTWIHCQAFVIITRPSSLLKCAPARFNPLNPAELHAADASYCLPHQFF